MKNGCGSFSSQHLFFFLSGSLIFPKHPPVKNGLHIRVFFAFFISNKEKYAPKLSSILCTIRAKRRGVFQPNFDKMGDILAYFPQEPNRDNYRDFPGGSGLPGTQTEPCKGPDWPGWDMTMSPPLSVGDSMAGNVSRHKKACQIPC